jgi:hypothetical protein
MNSESEKSISRALIHLLYTQTIKYKAAETALRAQLKDIWSKYRRPLANETGTVAEKKRALVLLNESVDELLKSFHQRHHVVIHLSQLSNLDQDFPFEMEMEYEGDDIPFTDPNEAGSNFPLRTVIFDLNSGLNAQLKSAKEFLDLERIKTSTEFTLEQKERRTNLSSIYKNLSFLVEKDTSKKTYEELSRNYKLSASTLKTMYAAAKRLLISGEIHRLFSPFPPGNQPRFKLTLKD